MTPTTKMREQADAAADVEEKRQTLTVGRGNKARPIKVLSRGQGGWIIGTRQTEPTTHKFIKDEQFQGRVEMGAVVVHNPATDQYDCQ